jgi:hypothetical protein
MQFHKNVNPIMCTNSWYYKQVTFLQMILKNALDTRPAISIYLLQGLFPAVALFAERTSKLLSMNAAALTRTRASNLTAGTSSAGATAGAAAGLTSIEIFGAHLFLQMLFQTCLVSKFAKAIGAFEGSVIAAMCRLHMVVEEPFFREVFATGHTNKGPLTGMDAVVNIQVGLAGVGLGADGADEGLLASVHPDVLLQAVVVIAGLLAQRAHEVGGLGMRGHVRS